MLEPATGRRAGHVEEARFDGQDFGKGRGSTFRVVKRHSYVSARGKHASFDELLDNASLTRCRGAGVLRMVDDPWRVEQYHLTIPVPNELPTEVVKRIREKK